MQILEHFKASAEQNGGEVSQKPCHQLLPEDTLHVHADTACNAAASTCMVSNQAQRASV